MAMQSLDADVYVREPVPLKEGEEKHVISVFVADEPGLINRVAGVFGRRGERQREHGGTSCMAQCNAIDSPSHVIHPLLLYSVLLQL